MRQREDIVDVAKRELRVFERVSQATAGALLGEVTVLREKIAAQEEELEEYRQNSKRG